MNAGSDSRPEPTEPSKLSKLFDAVLDLSEPEARARLETLGAAPAVADEVLALRSYDAERGPSAEALDERTEPDGDPLRTPLLPVLLPGNAIGSYALIEPISVGAAADVWKAESLERGGAPVAIKLQRLDVAAEMLPWVQRHLAREAECLRELDHPGIPPPLDTGTLPQGLAYIVLPYIDGEPLTRERAADCGRPLDQLAADLLDTVAAIHGAGWAHGDLGPDNVLITAEGEVFVIDLGSAERAESEADDRNGGACALPAWNAPERVRGNAPTRRSDVFSLGRLLARVLTEEAEGAAAQPAAMGVLARATAQQPGERFASAVELATAWHGAQTLDRQRERRRRVRARIGTLAAAGLLAAGAAWVFASRAASTERDGLRAVISLLQDPNDQAVARKLLETQVPGHRSILAQIAQRSLSAGDEASARTLLSELASEDATEGTAVEVEGWLRLGDLARARALLAACSVSLPPEVRDRLRLRLDMAQGSVDSPAAPAPRPIGAPPNVSAPTRPEQRVEETVAALAETPIVDVQTAQQEQLDDAVAALAPALARLGDRSPRGATLASNLAELLLRLDRPEDALSTIAQVPLAAPGTADPNLRPPGEYLPLPTPVAERCARIHARILLSLSRTGEAQRALERLGSPQEIETLLFAAILSARCSAAGTVPATSRDALEQALQRLPRAGDGVGQAIARWIAAALVEAPTAPDLPAATFRCMQILRTPDAPDTLRVIQALAAVSPPLGDAVEGTAALQQLAIDQARSQGIATLDEAQLAVWLCQELILRGKARSALELRPAFAESALLVAAEITDVLDAIEPLAMADGSLASLAQSMTLAAALVDRGPMDEIASRLLPMVASRVRIDHGDAAATPWWNLCGRARGDQ